MFFEFQIFQEDIGKYMDQVAVLTYLQVWIDQVAMLTYLHVWIRQFLVPSRRQRKRPLPGLCDSRVLENLERKEYWDLHLQITSALCASKNIKDEGWDWLIGKQSILRKLACNQSFCDLSSFYFGSLPTCFLLLNQWKVQFLLHFQK